MAGGQDKRQCNEMALSRSQQGSTDSFALAQQISSFELNAQSGSLDIHEEIGTVAARELCVQKDGIQFPDI